MSDSESMKEEVAKIIPKYRVHYSEFKEELINKVAIGYLIRGLWFYQE